MRPLLSKAELESALARRFGSSVRFHEKPEPQLVPSGIAEVDAMAGGFPRGGITEIFGPASSGRTSLMLSALAAATSRDEICALVDTNDAFSPAAAAAAGVALDRLLWVRCGGNANNALKSLDLLLQGGGFGMVVFDIGDIPPRYARKIPLASWFRFRRVIENTPTVMLAIEQEANAKSCASLVLEMERERTEWSGAAFGHLLRGARIQLARRKPVQSAGMRKPPQTAFRAETTRIGPHFEKLEEARIDLRLRRPGGPTRIIAGGEVREADRTPG
jgi:hypothetical protein